MSRRSASLFAASLLVASTLSAAQREQRPLAEVFAGLSLAVSDEAAPAGAIAQVKIATTEPKPISTGKGKIKVNGTSTINGIALMNRNQDTYGLAFVRGDEVSFSIVSPSNAFGNAADYPILSIAATVAPEARTGTRFPVSLDPSALVFTDAASTPYPYEVKDGSITVANVISVGDVSPGSGVVPAGTVITISGTNFNSDTRIQLNETSISSMRVVDSTRIEVVLAQTTDMHGLRIRARNKDNTEAEYFSYQRTHAMSSSSDPVMNEIVPLFAPRTYVEAAVPTGAQSVSRRRGRPIGRGGVVPPPLSPTAYGIALQNLQGIDAFVTVELLDSSSHPYAVNTLTVSPNRYLVRELSEIFGPVVAPAAIRIRSNSAVQFLGVSVDRSTGSARPIAPI